MSDACMIHLAANSNHALAHVVVTVIEHELVLHVRNGTATTRVVISSDEANQIARQLVRHSLELDGMHAIPAQGPRRRQSVMPPGARR